VPPDDPLGGHAGEVKITDVIFRSLGVEAGRSILVGIAQGAGSKNRIALGAIINIDADFLNAFFSVAGGASHFLFPPLFFLITSYPSVSVMSRK
jgi:hypothetical protein